MRTRRLAALAAALALCTCRGNPEPSGDSSPAPPDGGAARARVAALAKEAATADSAGQVERARRLRLDAIEAATAAGLRDQAFRFNLALVYASLYRTLDLTQAQRHLTAAAALAALPAEQAQLLYYQGLVARAAGDSGAALRALADATTQARTLNLPRDAWAAAQQHADLLAEVGRVDEALAAYRALESDSAGQTACDAAAYASSYGWVELEAAEANHPAAALPHATALFTGALDGYRRGCPQATAAIANALCNRAFAALLAGRLGDAQVDLDALDAGGPAPVYVELWRRDVAARLLAARGQLPQALAEFRRLETLADGVFATTARWRARLGQGRTLHQLRRPADAAEAYRNAEALLDDILLRMPVGEGRGTLALISNASASGLVASLLALHRPADAVAAARRARARVVRMIDRQTRLLSLPAAQRQRWDAEMARFSALRAQLQAAAAADWSRAGSSRAASAVGNQALNDQARTALQSALEILAAGGFSPDAPPTSPAAIGELTLGYFPLPDGWMGFADDGGRAIARRLIMPADLARADGDTLLAPFAGAIAAARRLRILPYGALGAIDFHALSFRGRPLIDVVPVVYGLDSGRRAADVARPERRLLIADPGGNLPGARREADQVLETWGAADTTTTLRGPQATRAAVLPAMERATALHYAGHGRHGGVEGLDSALPLADGGSLNVGDVLALAHVPAQVVLAGCETGRAPTWADVGLGLGQAFVLAGAREVVAATRPVPDVLAARLAGQLYRTPEQPLARALQQAQQQLARQDPSVDWAAFRIFVP